MPELCRFYGIIIRMFWADHPPPHFHAIYGNHEAVIEILTSDVIEGSLPLGAHSLVSQWVGLHREELLAALGTRSGIRTIGKDRTFALERNYSVGSDSN